MEDSLDDSLLEVEQLQDIVDSALFGNLATRFVRIVEDQVLLFRLDGKRELVGLAAGDGGDGAFGDGPGAGTISLPGGP